PTISFRHHGGEDRGDALCTGARGTRRLPCDQEHAAAQIGGGGRRKAAGRRSGRAAHKHSCHSAPLNRTSFLETLAPQDQRRATLVYSSPQGAAEPTLRLHLLMRLPSAPQAAEPSKQQKARPAAVS